MMDAVTKPFRSECHAAPPTQEEWIQTYTGRILRAWFHQQAPLGLAWTYANWIRKDLAECYAHSLKRAFVEETYRACSSQYGRDTWPGDLAPQRSEQTQKGCERRPQPSV